MLDENGAKKIRDVTILYRYYQSCTAVGKNIFCVRGACINIAVGIYKYVTYQDVWNVSPDSRGIEFNVNRPASLPIRLAAKPQADEGAPLSNFRFCYRLGFFQLFQKKNKTKQRKMGMMK
jgi:hypothetical protein